MQFTTSSSSGRTRRFKDPYQLRTNISSSELSLLQWRKKVFWTFFPFFSFSFFFFCLSSPFFTRSLVCLLSRRKKLIPHQMTTLESWLTVNSTWKIKMLSPGEEMKRALSRLNWRPLCPHENFTFDASRANLKNFTRTTIKFFQVHRWKLLSLVSYWLDWCAEVFNKIRPENMWKTFFLVCLTSFPEPAQSQRKFTNNFYAFWLRGFLLMQN